MDNANDRNKLYASANLVDTNVNTYISECTTYADAMDKPNQAYIKANNDIFVRHCLNTYYQDSIEALEDFFQRLKILNDDYNFTDATASQYKKIAIRDTFIAGFNSSYIRQRLLENNKNYNWMKS